MSFPGENRDDPPNNPSRPQMVDDLLPPVEPPSARFIIQLFVVPALIVLAIVSLWLTFTWLVRRTSPEALIQGLEHGPSVARWQRASELADTLRNRRFAEFKRNAAAADHLARILEREISQSGPGGMQDEDVTLRIFLARALGEFEVQNGIGVLLQAAETNRDPLEQIVRVRALEAIAMRAYNLRELNPPVELAHPELIPTLARLTTDDDPAIRSQTAYALGKIGTPAAIDTLEPLVDDPDADTRYNAAVGLAHHGNPRALETLAEMLDLEELSRQGSGTNPQDELLRKAVIVSNALGAIEALARQQSTYDFALVTTALERLSQATSQELRTAGLPARAASDARHALDDLRHLRPQRDR
jgi:HEAT repeat protein